MELTPAALADALDLPPDQVTSVLAGRATLTGVTHDSRAVTQGGIFVAIPGFAHDGADYAPSAIERGAALIIAERDLPGLPVLVVPDARGALAALAAAGHGNPSRDMACYGITGTNGKTTTSYALHAILTHAFGAERVGLTTTAETIIAGQREPSKHTTPEASEIQATLARMRDAGVERAVVEVSSHGIALQRIAGTHFVAALFTNLTRDHLDLHHTMEEYFATKRRLLEWALANGGPALANGDDPYGARLGAELPGVRLFGRGEDAAYRITEVGPHPDGTDVCLVLPDGERLPLHSPLLGSYNVDNIVGAAALALEVGVPRADVVAAVAEMPQVPGRFEAVSAGQDFAVVVDYAHTEVGLEAVLQVARETVGAVRPDARVIVAFGACGDRDGAKRPLMAEVACRLADEVIVTTDDAYTEDPATIAAEVMAGVPEGAVERAQVVLDRREAIATAFDLARPGDLVVIAGKGHERVQHLPDGDVDFHDATVARELLAGS